MKIYTKGGDTGETGLYGGSRVPKDDLRIRTYGTVDELNAQIGVVLSEPSLDRELAELRPPLLRIQGELFQLGAELATPRGKSTGIALIDAPQTTELEAAIDRMESQLPELKSFVLPGGSRAAAFLHVCRTVSRRAERELITLHRAEPQRPALLQYVNRLSDFLFVSARYANHLAGVSDVPWTPAAPR